MKSQCKLFVKLSQIHGPSEQCSDRTPGPIRSRFPSLHSAIYAGLIYITWTDDPTGRLALEAIVSVTRPYSWARTQLGPTDATVVSSRHGERVGWIHFAIMPAR